MILEYLVNEVLSGTKAKPDRGNVQKQEKKVKNLMLKVVIVKFKKNRTETQQSHNRKIRRRTRIVAAIVTHKNISEKMM